MTTSQKLGAFLEMAKARNEKAIEAVKFLVEEYRDGETNELEAVELVALDGNFFCTDLIVLAEALELSCYISINANGRLYVNIH